MQLDDVKGVECKVEKGCGGYDNWQLKRRDLLHNIVYFPYIIIFLQVLQYVDG